jgi:hypothetical protein
MKEIEALLLEWKEEGIPDDLIDRKLDADILERKANVLLGIRRAGKTYCMFQLMKKFDFERVFYINMEDDRIIRPNLRHLTVLVPSIRKLFEVKFPIYLFVDEIQTVDQWEKWARRIAESKKVVLFISGSSSKLSSKEIATSLRGRTNSIYVFPLSFEEFLQFREFTFNRRLIDYSSKKPDLMRLFNEYLKFGGFPEVVLQKEKRIKLKLLKEYFTTIIARDIIERFKIKNTLALETFMKYLLNNFSRYISFSKAANWMKSIGIRVGKATLREYYSYITQSFFINSTSIFSYKIKDVLQYPIKVYVADNGFITALTLGQENLGWLYENLVANELFKRSFLDPKVEIYYWKSGANEVDFVLKEGLRVKELIQVCFDVEDNKTKRRELRGLIKAGEELKCKNLLIITGDYEGEEKVGNRSIKFIPLWKWLLKK